MNRRGLLGGLLAAPAVIRSPGLLMRLATPRLIMPNWWTQPMIDEFKVAWNNGILVEGEMGAARLVVTTTKLISETGSILVTPSFDGTLYQYVHEFL